MAQQQFTPAMYAPDLQQRQLELQRKQMMAQELLRQGMQPNEGRMVSGHYVRPDAGKAIANALSLYAGYKGMSDLPRQQAELQQLQAQRMAEMFGFGGQSSGDQAQTFPVGESGSPQQPAVSQDQQPMVLPGFSAEQSRNLAMTIGPQAYAKALIDSSPAGNRQGMSGLVPTDRGYAYRNPDGTTGFLMGDDGKPLMPVSLLSQDPNRQGDIAQAKAFGTETGKGQAQAEAAAPQELASMDQIIGTIDSVLQHPGLDSAVGMVQGRLPAMTEEGTDFVAKLGQLQGQTFLQAYQSLRGGGQITEVEGQKAEAALAAMTRVQSEKQFRQAANDFKNAIQDARSRVAKRAGIDTQSQQSSPAGNTSIPRIQSPNEYANLPSGALFIAPDGTQRRKP